MCWRPRVATELRTGDMLSFSFSQNPPRVSGGSQNQNMALNTRGASILYQFGEYEVFPQIPADTRFLPTESPWTLPQSTVPPGCNNQFPGPRWTPQETQFPQSLRWDPRPPESLILCLLLLLPRAGGPLHLGISPVHFRTGGGILEWKEPPVSWVQEGARCSGSEGRAEIRTSGS